MLYEVITRTSIAASSHAGERRKAMPRKPAAKASFDAPADGPIGATRRRRLAGSCANTQTVITSYSIHYTKLYEDAGRVVRDGSPAELWDELPSLGLRRVEGGRNNFV